MKALGAEVIGLSADDEKTNCDFAASLKVTFPMLGEGNREVIRLYGVKWPLIAAPKRVTFLIDPQGVVKAVFHHEIQIARHLDDVVNTLKKLQQARGLATP